MTTYFVRHLYSHSLTVAAIIAGVSLTTAAAQQPAQQPAAPPVDRAALERQAEINARPDTPGSGRFAAMKEEVAALPRHVVYRPKDLAALGRTIRDDLARLEGPVGTAGRVHHDRRRGECLLRSRDADPSAATRHGHRTADKLTPTRGWA